MAAPYEAPSQLQPAEEAALTGHWWAALLLCWRGFRDVPGAERSYQAFRAAFLWRWDLVARSYHMVVGLALTAKAFDQPQAKAALWGWAGLPGGFAERGMILKQDLLLMTSVVPNVSFLATCLISLLSWSICCHVAHEHALTMPCGGSAHSMRS
jgi:hypothetical protein